MITKFNIFESTRKGDALVARILDISQKENTKFVSFSNTETSGFEIIIDHLNYFFPHNQKNTLIICSEFAYIPLSKYKFSNKMYNELLDSFNKPEYKLKYNDVIHLFPSMEKDEQFMNDYRKLSEEGRASNKYNL